MRRLVHAPNLALATLWADMLTHAGIAATVQRPYASSIAGELRHPTWRHWRCPGCGEIIDGPFEQCWNCGTAMPDA
jgi:hypothetical protein